MATKMFDCVQMKRACQEVIRREVRGMTPAEEIAYFRAAGDRLESQIRAAKKTGKPSISSQDRDFS